MKFREAHYHKYIDTKAELDTSAEDKGTALILFPFSRYLAAI